MQKNLSFAEDPVSLRDMLPKQGDGSGLVIERRQVKNWTVFVLSGRMTAESAPEFDRNCKASIAEGHNQVIIDVGDLAYVSSMGLRSFLAIAKMLEVSGGSLRVCRLTGLVKQVFEITGLTKAIRVYESAESALMGG
jgi:anti-sigma B factor antagonist